MDYCYEIKKQKRVFRTSSGSLGGVGGGHVAGGRPESS
jgi:hypothetical protein